jgi:hypothetical protein
MTTLRFAEPADRAAAGARIDPATAQVWFQYVQILDPYGELDLEPECHCIGRVFFAADPVERIAVSFYELPEEIAAALRDKRNAADQEGWSLLLSDASR